MRCCRQAVVVRMEPRRVVLLVFIVVLAVVSLSVSWHFATAGYPVRSDVFWYGVMAGFLGSLLLTCLALIGVLAFKLSKK
jgi:uncharacterized membrane protein